jgi:tellurite resistance protein TehA-like permease
LLLVTFVVALAVSAAMALVFARPIRGILDRIIAEEISMAWYRYLNFAILVVGTSAGVRIHDLEKYITPLRNDKDATIIELTVDRWLLELYRTVIETLQGIAWLLLVFFGFALIAYVLVRSSELKRKSAGETQKP